MALEDIQIIDNFLDQQYFDDLSFWCEVHQPWQIATISGIGDPNMPQEEKDKAMKFWKKYPPHGNLQLVSRHYDVSPDFHISPDFGRFIPMLTSLKSRVPVRIKVNLITGKDSHIPSPYHYDENPPEAFGDNCKVAIIHLNTCNGWTNVQHPDLDNFEQKIDTVANRAIIFSNKYPHRGTTCTDKPYRSVINVNYYGDKIET
tara:strand:- start:45 stop:650 length:606 start_codon:yes stop_codon:yes gene_type:complete